LGEETHSKETPKEKEKVADGQLKKKSGGRGGCQEASTSTETRDVRGNRDLKPKPFTVAKWISTTPNAFQKGCHSKRGGENRHSHHLTEKNVRVGGGSPGRADKVKNEKIVEEKQDLKGGVCHKSPLVLKWEKK